MLVGLLIAAVAYILGAPLLLAVGLGIGYAVLAFIVTPRSAYVGGLFGPKPRPGKIPGPGSMREMDLDPQSIDQMTARVKAALPELSRERGIHLVDAWIGNIGRHRGQFWHYVVRLSDDHQQAAVERGRALIVIVGMLAPASDDVREARIRFVDSVGRPIAEATVDMSAASSELIDDEGKAAAYAAAHTRTKEH